MPLLDFLKEKVITRGLATGQATQNAPRSTFGQFVERKAGAALQKLDSKPKKKGAITYSIQGGELSGTGEGFAGTFSKDDINKFDFDQITDLAGQLDIEVTDEVGTRKAINDAIAGTRTNISASRDTREAKLQAESDAREQAKRDEEKRKREARIAARVAGSR